MVAHNIRRLALVSEDSSYMQVAVSRQLDLGSEASLLGMMSVERARQLHHGAAVADSAREIPTVPFADVEIALVKPEAIIPRKRDEVISRVLNVSVAAIALVVFAPLFALIALVIAITSRGPVLYSQVRVGMDRRWRYARAYDRRGYDHGGKLFKMYKFRTMRVDAEPDGRAVWASRCDPRVTLVGRFLRTSRLDELPQLWNVICGEMNIVGPRPERPSIFAELRKDIPEYPLRQRVKPGITGWAQVNRSYDACLDDVRQKVALDLEYVRRQGVFEDLRIMSMTLPVMLFRRGGW
jgi:lipopolysaccharide/colanic/teichoic acid biosynthesis glycosyltransferase